ncbi:M1 family metallopeptidase [Flavobacterium psychrophilum]|uniref:M1 family metallopeptidase n=1 Tax=Flavobacterium psychrophilum TaxID=96345 RepID=UPI0004F59376|nr:M1 family metallopeptidase [Flavobacterium psychrophilum]AIN74731.1 peptidase M1 [Flavobacterium psychrophilum FPG3]EKT2069901.1 M1 family metallopeptidase [Flavobacterium psychrophilum]EKT2072291.1 M1 family metallopeptidase [Flavobacterium psychrophilum]EKT4491720.1 M1 family metallopeptidase [Flavobacterium psychrophilum]EKT4549538.1 M1 family metallopeptidase [Flavobacterium psychrophilum]
MKNTLFFLLFTNILTAQLTVPKEKFTHRDSLQGGFRAERTCFDVQRYDLNIKVNPTEKFIIGYNDITFKVVENTNKIQIDLFENMQVDSIIFNHKKLNYKRDNLAVFITFNESLKTGNQEKIRFYYSGNPTIAKRAPWDGGFVFTNDKQGKTWIGVACQGFGASCWYPVKDSQSDEPNLGATIKVAVPNGLMNVSNGRLLGSEDLKNGYTRWDWEVKNPINTYDITLNIGDYIHFGEKYKGLDLDYYVLRENEEKARKQFEEVKPMMDCFQSKFGEYPFTTDGYKLVETPYLGMEHQSAVAYGNHYNNGYLGKDLSRTGMGMLFDFIIIHESGHEWFGNSITARDIADMWIHEGFTCYTETVFLECQYGYEKSQIYINGLKDNVNNDQPIIGHYGVNKEGSGDMYYKGALMLNTIRSIINDDSKWWALLLKYSKTYRHQIIDTKTVIDFFNQEAGLNLTPVFNQYLRYVSIPRLEFRHSGTKNQFEYAWKTNEPNFEMPIDLIFKNKKTRLIGTNKWQKVPFKMKNVLEIEVVKNKFYITTNL